MGSVTTDTRPQILDALADHGIAASDVLVWTLRERDADLLALRHGEMAVISVALAEGTCWVLVRQLA